jgi:hypothetical protein
VPSRPTSCTCFSQADSMLIRTARTPDMLPAAEAPSGSPQRWKTKPRSPRGNKAQGAARSQKALRGSRPANLSRNKTGQARELRLGALPVHPTAGPESFRPVRGWQTAEGWTRSGCGLWRHACWCRSAMYLLLV